MINSKDWRIELLLKLGLWKIGSEYQGHDHQHKPNNPYRLHKVLAKTTVRAHWSYIGLLLAVFWCLVSLVWDFIFSGEQSWFQRSGSILVMCSIIATYYGYIDSPPGSTPNQKFFEITKRFIIVRQYSRLLAIATAIFGTLIWGYGDLLVPDRADICNYE